MRPEEPLIIYRFFKDCITNPKRLGEVIFDPLNPPFQENADIFYAKPEKEILGIQWKLKENQRYARL